MALVDALRTGAENTPHRRNGNIMMVQITPTEKNGKLDLYLFNPLKMIVISIAAGGV